MKEKELKIEREVLKDTKQWLDLEIKKLEDKTKDLEEKLSRLKKGGLLQNSNDIKANSIRYEAAKKNISNFNEAYDKPYFAKIDFREYKKEKESFYIGKFSIGDSDSGDQKVIDWREPLADLYYSGTQGWSEYRAPIGVIEGELSLKRKFKYKDDEIEDIFDEGINDIILKASGEEGESALVDEFLKLTLDESTGSKLKDVVATIQKEQNDIIRAPKVSPIIVQGSAGSGKTTVALHRLAYLLYRYNETLKGEDILVIAPNKVFLDYISDVLPSLGASEVKQKTFEEIALEILKIKGKLENKDKKLASVLEIDDHKEKTYIKGASSLKNSLEFKIMLDRYIKLIQIEQSKISSIFIEEEELIEGKEIRRLFLKDLIHLPVNKRKDEIKRYLNLRLKTRIEYLIDKIENRYDNEIFTIKRESEDSELRREKIRKLYDERDSKKEIIKKNSKKVIEEYFKAWKSLDARSIYLRFFQDEDLFSIATDDRIPKKLSNYIKNKLKEDIEKGRVDSDDLAPMLYLKFNLEEIPEKYRFSHVVVDEAQDYGILQMHILKYLAKKDSLTIVGDIGQGIYFYKGIKDWKDVIEGVFKGNCLYTPLTQSYRSTVEIIEFANEVLKKQKNSLTPAMPVLRHGKKPEIKEFKNNKDFLAELEYIVKEIRDNGKSSVAVIGRTQKECKKIYDYMRKNSVYSWTHVKEGDDIISMENIVIPSYMTKGLEFDCSIIYNCNDENYKEDEEDKKLLYVALTRALHYEYIFYNGNLSYLIDK
ncbi:RNA polymerase recycling motor HelD [Clostridium sp.]|uniref:RNA polymerase recycling motor HelD n=1 Tax=Clostridium sp. TaxID=1506 RepID=UPI003463E0FF